MHENKSNGIRIGPSCCIFHKTENSLGWFVWRPPEERGQGDVKGICDQQDMERILLPTECQRHNKGRSEFPGEDLGQKFSTGKFFLRGLKGNREIRGFLSWWLPFPCFGPTESTSKESMLEITCVLYMKSVSL